MRQRWRVPFKVHISDTVLHDLTVAWIKQGGQSTAWGELGEWGRQRSMHALADERCHLEVAYLAKKPI
jgi:hypothetical protein